MKLYNLTYEDKYYSSCMEPKSLPEDNFCYIEIEYKNSRIENVKGVFVKDEIRKESVLSDLNVEIYLEKLKEFLKREDVDKDKIHINFVENIQDEDERIFKIFLILISSYLIYFNFMQFPYTVSLSLLEVEKFKYFTSFSPVNKLEVSFLEQVSLLHRYFSEIFNDDKNKKEEVFIQEIRQYKKRMLADVDKKLLSFQTEVEELKSKLSDIFKNF